MLQATTKGMFLSKPPSSTTTHEMYGILVDGKSKHHDPEKKLQDLRRATTKFASTVEPLLYDHPQNHIGVVV